MISSFSGCIAYVYCFLLLSETFVADEMVNVSKLGRPCESYSGADNSSHEISAETESAIGECVSGCES